MIAHSVGQSSS